jgi:hypothetical protein
MLQLKGTFGFGSTTATGAAYSRLITPRPKFRAVITSMVYICSTTAHAVNLIRPYGSTTVAATAAAGQKVVTLSVDPGLAPKGPNGTASLLGNSATTTDFLVFQTPGGEYYYDLIASVAAGAISGQISATMTSNLPTNGLAAGATVWLHKASGGKDPFTGLTQESFNFPASTTTTIADASSGIFSAGVYQPILIYDANATADGTLLAVSGGYTELGQ